MFKVGDRGKTRGGFDYEVTDCPDGVVFAGIWNDPDYTNTMNRSFDEEGNWLKNIGEHRFDLMPPDSHDYNMEGECIPAKDECILTQLADLAESRNVTIEYRVGDISYTFTRTNSVT